MEGAFIIGNGQVTPIHGGLHQYKAHDGAKFADNSLVKVRRLKHLKHLPETGAIVACIPAGVSVDHVWADYRGVARPLMCEVPARSAKYIVAFEGDPRPHIIRERDLTATDGVAEIGMTE